MEIENNSQDRRESMKEFLNEPITSPEIEAEVEEEIDADEVDDLEQGLEGDEHEETEEGDEPETVEGDDEESDEVVESDETELAETPEKLTLLDGDGKEVEVEVEVLQTHHNMVSDLLEALDGTNYPIDFTDNNKGMEELGARLADAHAFYEVLDGTAPVDNLFARLKQYQGDKAHDFVLGQVLEYAKKLGIIEGGETNNDGSLVDPVAEQNKRLQADVVKREAATRTAAVQQQQQKIYNSAVAELKHLSEGKKVDDWTFQNVLIPTMARNVGGNKAILNRITRGNFVDIHRIFDEAISHIETRRVATNNRRVAGRRTRDNRVPKQVSGGDRPVAAARKPANFGNSDERRAAAKAYLNK